MPAPGERSRSSWRPCSSEDSDPVRTSLRMVDEADIYIGIYAHRDLGYVPGGGGMSITEME